LFNAFETIIMITHTQGFTLLGTAAAVALSGCASTLSPVQKAVPDSRTTSITALTPSRTAVLKPGLSIDRWWTLLGDTSLDVLMDEALERNADLEVALARVREARANLEVSRAARSPAVDAKFQNGRNQQSAVSTPALPPGADRLSSTHSAALAASHEIDLWGKLSASAAAVRQQLLAAEWAHASIEWSLTSSVAETYLELAAVDRQIEISDAVREGRAATLRMRKFEHEIGAGSEFDVRRAEAELTATEVTLASYARQRAGLERMLIALLGRSPAQIATGTLTRTRLDERKSREVVLPHSAAADLLIRRPDIRQAEAQLAAANFNVEAARAATMPSLRLTGSLGSDTRSLSDLFSGPGAIWSIAASATQSLFDAGRQKSQVRAEQARAEQMLADYRKVIALAVGELREAYEVLDITHQGLRAERERASALTRAKDLAQFGYDNGAYSYLDVLDAERNLYQAQLSGVTACRDRLLGQVAVLKALGGGYAVTSTHNESQVAFAR
jgi:multidrug efflux system outer membrane protein